MQLDEKVSLWRQIFAGRDDVFSYKRYGTKAKKPPYNPVVKNEEATTLEEKYIPLSDSYVKEHIEGSKELGIYLLNTEDKVKFAAIDFDLRHNFEDVLNAYDVISKHHNFPCYIARSTSKGHHLYMFFDQWVDANIVTTYINHVYEMTGWLDELIGGGRALPETFPKSVHLGNSTVNIDGTVNFPLGFAIKPPMCGKNTKDSKSCFVDTKDQPIGAQGSSDEQWDYIKSIKRISVKDIISFLNDNEIPISDIRLSEKSGAVDGTKSTVPYKEPTDGDFHLILEGCPALNRMWNGDKTQIPHMGRVAMLTYALTCKNGLEMITEFWADPITGVVHPEAQKHIDSCIKTNQRPWRCSKMQEYGFCVKGRDPKKSSGNYVNKETGEIYNDYCFEKAPPKEIVNGRLEVNPHRIPKEQWKSPSPSRLRIKNVKWTVVDVEIAIENLKEDDPNIDSQVAAILYQLQIMSDKEKVLELRKKLKARKIKKAGEIDATEKNIKAKIKKEKKEQTEVEKQRIAEKVKRHEEEIEQSDDIVRVNDAVYAKLPDDKGYAEIFTNKQGDREVIPFSNFIIEMHAESTVYSLFHDKKITKRGVVKVDGRTFDFEFPSEILGSPTEFARTLYAAASSRIVFKPKDMHKLMACISAFSCVNEIEENIYQDHGFDKSVYRSGEICISQEGISECLDHKIQFPKNNEARNLKLTNITDDEFKEAINVILNDLMTLQKEDVVWPALTHTLQASIHTEYIQKQLPNGCAPHLLLVGTTGTVKTVLGHILQQFYGDFEKCIPISSTIRSIEAESAFFKDALIVLDDYKEAEMKKKKPALIEFLQNANDRTARKRLNSNLEQAKAPSNKGLIMITAEEVISGTASIVARSILVRTSKKDNLSRREFTRRMDSIRDASHLFKGVTARFVHYVISTYKSYKDLRERYRDYIEWLQKPFNNEIGNVNRISENMAGNMLTFELFTEFLLKNNFITTGEFHEYMEDYKSIAKRITSDIVTSCGGEVAVTSFLSVLNQALCSGDAYIEGVGELPSSGAQKVGFLLKSGSTDVCLLRDIAVGVVNKIQKSKGATLAGTVDSIGKQLAEMNYITKTSSNSDTLYRTQRRNVTVGRIYTWCIDGVQAGFLEGDIEHQPDTDQEKSNVIDHNFWKYNKKK